MKTPGTIFAVFIGGAGGSQAASLTTIPAEAPIQGPPDKLPGGVSSSTTTRRTSRC